jgi:2-dehydro-3-deoxyphosphogluconate aldolase / (4S)-4-hydroxy-2-oxoglutarate aldolase
MDVYSDPVTPGRGIAIEAFLRGLGDARLLAILRGRDPRATIDTALELLDAGFLYLEVSLTTQDALTVIGRIAERAPGHARIGAGTVVTADQTRRARNAGATFIVTPALTEGGAEAVRLGMPLLSGALTPTETVQAMAQGATGVKLFPASVGGPAYLSALRDPFPETPFVPVGGVDAELAEDYLARGALAVGVGGPLIGDAAHGGDDAGALRQRAREFLDVAERHSRGGS